MKQYLESLYLERYLASEMTFGFEFEGIYNLRVNRDATEKEFIKIIKYYFPEWKGRDIDDDSSIESDMGERTFEWQSPILNMTMQNIQRTIAFFTELNDINFFKTKCNFKNLFCFTNNDKSFLIYDVKTKKILFNKYYFLESNKQDQLEIFLKQTNFQRTKTNILNKTQFEK